VSLLERLGRGHLSDRTFARLWTEQGRHPHLDACAECRARYEAFELWLAGIGDTMRDEADEALPQERLVFQQAQIARRLETLDRPVRVIAFPKAARAVISGHSHVRRWVTVAAAASLIAGFGLGQVVPPLRSAIAPPQPAASAVPHTATEPSLANRVKEITPASNSINEDELLSDAFDRPKLTTLSALDDMTPHARDRVLNRRNKDK